MNDKTKGMIVQDRENNKIIVHSIEERNDQKIVLGAYIDDIVDATHSDLHKRGIHSLTKTGRYYLVKNSGCVQEIHYDRIDQDSISVY